MKQIRPILVVCVALALTSAALASEWPHLRGPNFDGRLSSAGVFAADRPVGLELAWSVPLGSGYSGVAVAGERAVTLYTDGQADWAVALDTASGETAWRYRISEPTKGHDGADDGPLSSPLIDDGVVYALGAAGQLFALRLTDGKELWRRDLQKEFGAQAPHFGFTTTPLVDGKVLVVQTGGSDGRAISGLDKKTGKTLWSTGEAKVDYQSPVLLDLAGKRQIVAASGNKLHGILPATGEVLWEHEFGEEDSLQSASPTYAGKDRLLVLAGGQAVVLSVSRGGEGYKLTEQFRTKELGNTYATPVYHDGHLYGFRGQFLTCVDGETGERVWKSRPPGGGGLILVDGHLVIFGSEGNVVVAKATPDGYQEQAKVKALEGSSLTWPSFADGKVFVRNLEGLASVSVVESATKSAAKADAGPPQTEFGKFVRGLAAAPDKAERIDKFMGRHGRTPIVEGSHVHFVYRGDVEDVALSGTMIASGNAEPMERVPGTDFYYKSYRLEPGGRWEYYFNINFDERVADPLNPSTVPATFGNQEFSEFSLPGYQAPEHLGDPQAERRGKLETFTFKSEMLDNEREVTVYLPPGYDTGDGNYPLLLVHQGKDWLEKGKMTNTLDNLVGKSVAPLVVAFVNPIGRWWIEAGGSGTDDYARMLAEELVPHLEQKYRLQSRAESRAVMGTTYFGLTAAYTALKYPDVFGKVAMQSVALGLGSDEALMELIRGKHHDAMQFYLDWNRFERRRVDSGLDLHDDNTKLAAALRDNGYQVAGGEVLDSHGWGSWRARTDKILETLFPVR